MTVKERNCILILAMKAEGFENLCLRGFYFGKRPWKKEKTFLTITLFPGIRNSMGKIEPTRPKKW
jgi:hypothetical protein